ncbi:MAG: WD40 repeat domain-containing protein [Proteobacteria bacterium]|nr:WD40 repeat domain-containing protein [Pseudomonadota bacterium]
MVELPQRFVPTTSRFVSPVRIVIQSGHAYAITAVAFSPCLNYFASVDCMGWARIWAVETLDILGIYKLNFVCKSIEWTSLGEITFIGEDVQRVVSFTENCDHHAQHDEPLAGYVIRLLTSPEVSREGDIIRILYNEETFEHELPGLIGYELDPCERFVIALTTDKIIVLNTYADEVMQDLAAPQEHHWIASKCSSRGDFVTAVLDDGTVWQLNPIKHTQACIHKGNERITSCCYGQTKLILMGDDRGSVAIFDIETRSILLRTPRQPRNFEAVYPSPDKVGLVALRTESATAYLCQSQEILSSAPLPAAHVASCPGMMTSEVIVACADNAIYRIKLDDNTILKLCVLKKSVKSIACHGEMIFIHFEDGTSGICIGKNFSDCAWKSEETALSLAISDDEKMVALLFENHLEWFAVDDPQKCRKIELHGAAQIAFGKEKSADTIFVFMQDFRVLTINSSTEEQKELNRLAIEHGRILSTAPAAKSFVYVLIAGEHGHLCVLKVGLNSAKSSLALRVFAVGTQIWGATMNDESVSLRNDANCLRIVQDLKSYSVDDWTRSEPLALF